jgi:hypothetical protein
MACNLESIEWTTGISVLSAILVLDGNFKFNIETLEGFDPELSQEILPGDPLVVTFETTPLPGMKYGRGNWNGECGEGELQSISVTSDGFALRSDGKALGATTNETGELMAFFINLVNFPVVLSTDGDQVSLTFRDDPTCYFYTQVK